MLWSCKTHRSLLVTPLHFRFGSPGFFVVRGQGTQGNTKSLLNTILGYLYSLIGGITVRRPVAVAVVFALLLTAAVATGGNEYKGFPVAQVIVNGKPVQSDVPAIIMDGRTLLPVRAVAEAIGGKVDWNQDTYTVNITYR